MDRTDPPDPPPRRGRMVVLSGQLDDVEMAAVTAAIDELHAERDQAPPPAPSRWTRAARLEAAGHPPIDSPARLPRR